jgi:hypothetical protein
LGETITKFLEESFNSPANVEATTILAKLENTGQAWISYKNTWHIIKE